MTLDAASSAVSWAARAFFLAFRQSQFKSINASRQSLTFWPSETVQIHQHQQTEPYLLALRVSSKASTPADTALLSGPQTVSSNPSTPADRALLSGSQSQFKGINTSRQSLAFRPSDRVSSNPSTPADKALPSGPLTGTALLSGLQSLFKSINTNRQSVTF